MSTIEWSASLHIATLLACLHKLANTTGRVEMEEQFCSVALYIIGKAVVNFDFGSVTNELLVIKAVYSIFLVEAEHRSMTPAPYWGLPFANQLVTRLHKFNSDLKLRLLNDILDNLIDTAKATRSAF
jgi:hypothetical protein